MRKVVYLIAVAGLFGSAPAALAVSANITAQANVLTPITNTNSRNLDFGDVFPGLNKSIAYTDATSGKWSVDGEPGKEVSLTFTALPATLVKGGDNLTIVYSATDAGSHTSDVPGSATDFDPSAGDTPTLDGTTGELYVWIGGQVQPTAGQAAGLYTETITLDVVYTGN